MTQPFRSQSSVMDLPLDNMLEFDVSSPDDSNGSSTNSASSPSRAKRPDADANFLMDELFGEVEQVLDGSLIPPDEPMTIEQKRSEIQFDIASVLAERYPQLAMKIDEPTANAGLDLELPELPAPETSLSKVTEKNQSAKQPSGGFSLFERFMIFTGCASAIAALAVWLIAQGLLPKGITALSQKLQTTAQSATQPTGEPAVSETDVKFSEYMLRSLAAIDRNIAAKPPAPQVAILPSPSPSANVTGSGTKLPQPAPLGVAKIGTPATSGLANSNMPAPVPVQPTGDMVTRREMNQVMNRIMGMLERVAPGVSNRLQLPKSAAPAVTTGKAAAARATAKVGVASAPISLPQRTLTGVIEMGDRSAVLFELNGVTQRIYLGESVGSTGWSLVEVSKDAAIFRRNGEVRTIGVGQKL